MQTTLEQIRMRLQRWVRERASSQSGHPCEESFLLKAGKLHGCRFMIGEVSALWIIGESTIEIRSPGQSDTLVISGQTQTPRAA
jgi:hypothetical protein